MVVDMNGVKIKKGQDVLVHQEDGVSHGVVVETMEDSPTVNEPGHWVDIYRGDGLEGMMSYCLEVVADK